MNLEVSVTTNAKDLFIDYIEVKLKSGRRVGLDWEKSFIERNPNGFSAEYEHVYIDHKAANGRLAELKDLKIAHVGVYSEERETADVCIDSFLLQDSVKVWEMPGKYELKGVVCDE